MRQRRATAAAVLLAAGAAFAASAMTGGSPAPPRAVAVSRPAEPISVPPVTKPAFVPGAPRWLDRRPLGFLTPVRYVVAARARPASNAPIMATLGTRTPEGTTNAVTVIGWRRDTWGRLWVRARLPILPTGAIGWLPRRALGGYRAVHARLDVDLTRLRLTLHRRDRRVLVAPIGIGMAGWDTPRGTFYIRNKLTRYSSPQYGPVAFGTSARSPVATDWPAGGFIGIHGTDRPDLIPGRISHGCIRLRNEDVLALSRLMPIGTLVRIH